MRGTLHLVSARDYDRYRVACRDENNPLRRRLRLLGDVGCDLDAIREEILAVLRERPLNRVEVARTFRHLVPAHLPDWVAFSAIWMNGVVMNAPEDARFGHFGGSHYRPAPPPVADPQAAMRHVVSAYLAAFGPASRADIAQGLGKPVRAFAPALESLELVRFTADDGRDLLDLPDAPRPDASAAAPVRFLPKWDSILLAHARRERVLPQSLRYRVI